LLSNCFKICFSFSNTENTDDSYVSAHVHTLSSRVAGTVMEVLVDENQRVKKGDVLVRLDQRDFLAQLKIAEASNARANKDMNRWSGAQVDTPTDRLVRDTSLANQLTSEGELEKAKLQVEYTTLIAPEDGIIGKRNVETGQQVQAGQALLALVENKPWVTANFKEANMRI